MNIRRHKQRSVPRLNMASMPDLIFTVLFFFMIVTHMRSESPRLSVETPEGKELTQPQNKRSMVNLYIGTDKRGVTHIQVGDRIVSVEQIGAALSAVAQPSLMDDEMQGGGTVVNIKADRNTPMGVVADVKQQLRNYGYLSIRYNATEKKD